MNKFFKPFMICSIVLLLATPARASVERAYFAGFAFLGDAADTRTLFPYSSTLIDEKDASDISILEIELTSRLKKNLPRNFTLDFGLSDDEGAVALAFALAWENVTIEKLGNVYSIVVDLSANILAFDFSEKKIIAAFPVGVSLKSGSDSQPSKGYISSLVRGLYLSDEFGVNIFNEFAKRLGEIHLNSKYQNYIQLVSVKLSEKAAAKLIDISPLDAKEFSHFVGQNFTSFLSSQQNVGILPFTKGQVIGGKMPARFASAEVFSFTLPEPDYEMEIEYAGFGKKKLDETAKEVAWLYVTGIQLKVSEPLTRRTYLDADFRDKIVKRVVAGESEPDDWSGYQLAFFNLARGLSEQVSIRSDEWLSSRSKTQGVSDQLSKFEEVLKRCR